MSQINITITDEFEESEQRSTAKLNLDTGKISDLRQESSNYRKPWMARDYSFSSGLLKVGSKELEFVIQTSKEDGHYVSATEINEIKQKMASLVSEKSVIKRKRM